MRHIIYNTSIDKEEKIQMINRMIGFIACNFLADFIVDATDEERAEALKDATGRKKNSKGEYTWE